MGGGVLSVSGGARVCNEGGGGWAGSSGPLAGAGGDGARVPWIRVGNGAGTVGDGSSGGLLGEVVALESIGSKLDARLAVGADPTLVVFGGAGRGIDDSGALWPAVGAI